MIGKDRWLLPEGIEEMLPAEARRFEALRRRLLDLFDTWGYELVMPPTIEYLDSLLTGTGTDLDLHTFKLIDQLTGRLMGVRADMTPQAARIDAHYLKRSVPVRLCYLGAVLRARPGDFAGSREPIQLGAELFGHGGAEADVEVLRLMLTTLASAGIGNCHVDLGHVGVFRGLAAEAKLDADQEADLFDALQRKARPEIEALLASWNLPPPLQGMIAGLIDLSGEEDVLRRARTVLKPAGAAVQAALDNLEAITRRMRAFMPTQVLHFDLAELHGYRYYTGAVFSALVPGQGQAIAQGGRYDDIGKAFGRARPAVGFSTDLRLLLKLLPGNGGQAHGICAPDDDDTALQERIAALRAQGARVVVALKGHAAAPAELGCDRELVYKNGAWVVSDARASRGKV